MLIKLLVPIIKESYLCNSWRPLQKTTWSKLQRIRDSIVPSAKWHTYSLVPPPKIQESSHTERFQETEEQEVCCGLASPRKTREVISMTSQQHGHLNKTWTTGTPRDMLIWTLTLDKKTRETRKCREQEKWSSSEESLPIGYPIVSHEIPYI